VNNSIPPFGSHKVVLVGSGFNNTKFCSFCGKSKHKDQMVVGPAVTMCIECILTCNEVLIKKRLNALYPVRNRSLANLSFDSKKLKSIKWCKFCGKFSTEVRFLLEASQASICDECLGLCNKMIGKDRFQIVE
jgi:ATP-dependent protease Clp ATPase subunit